MAHHVRPRTSVNKQEKPYVATDYHFWTNTDLKIEFIIYLENTKYNKTMNDVCRRVGVCARARARAI